MRLVVLMVCVLVAGGCQEEKAGGESGERAVGDTAAVRAAFDRYRIALRTADARGAVASLDTATIAHYGRMGDLALTGDEKTVRALPLLEQVLVLALRHRVPLDTLQMLHPTDIVAYTLRPGWMGETAMQQDLTLGRIEIDGEEATAEASAVGETTGQLFRFVRQEAVWKIDLLGITRGISQRIEGMIPEAEREKAIRGMLEKATGRSLEGSLWTPPLRAPAPVDSTG